jgi:acyl-CoA synthetase (AMP-forming)/AMP-acid ligase II
MHLLLMMQIAGEVIPARHSSPHELLQLIESRSANSLSGINPQWFTELLGQKLAERRLSSLARIGLHGAVLRPELLRDIRASFPNVDVGSGYGLTETNGSIALAGAADIEARPGTAGPFVPSVEARIVDENDRDLPCGCTGEIKVRGGMLMSGYCGAPQASARALRDGWFHSGDTGHMDADGFLYVSDRQGDIFCLEGASVSSSRLEQLAWSSASIRDVAVLRGPGPDAHARVFVAIVPSREHAETETLLAETLCRNLRLPRRAFEIISLDQLPRTSSGKIDRRELHARLLKGSLAPTGGSR